MKRFLFPLDRVLDWKTVIAQQEQTALESLHTEREQITASLLCLNDRIGELSGGEHPLESGHELAYAAQARSVLLRSKKRMEEEQTRCETKIESQQGKVRTAETERRLVGKLKERDFAKWSAEASRDMDDTAADLFLGGWNRR